MPSGVRHHSEVNRHDEFISLAGPYAHDGLVAAEIYRVRMPPTAQQPWIIGGIALLMSMVAIGSGEFWVGSRFVLGAIFCVVLLAYMVLRRLRRKPNLVLLALGPAELLILRATFLSMHWRVIDEIGRWDPDEIEAVPGPEVLALNLKLPTKGLLDLTPLAVSRDASQISVALIDAGVEPKGRPSGA